MEVSDATFELEVLDKSHKKPVVVDFWAGWCGPCMMLGPIIEKVEKDYKGKFILAKANVDQNQMMASEYGVMSIPSVKLFKKGKVVAEFIGAKPESSIKAWLDENL